MLALGLHHVLGDGKVVQERVHRLGLGAHAEWACAQSTELLEI